MQTYTPVALMLAMLSSPAMAQEVRIDRYRYAVTLTRAALPSETAAKARRSLQRIDRAATAVCGAPDGSLRDVTTAVRRTACWRDAVDDAVRRIDAPLLSQAWQDRR